MTLRPRQLPKLREQLLRHLDDPDASIRAHTGEGNQDGLDVLAGHLRHAELYWVAPDMTALAMSSGAQLAAARWATADRPAPCGLILFDGGVGSVDAQGVDVPVEGCVWGPSNGECSVALLLSRRRLVAEMAEHGFPGQLIEEKVPPLLPLAAASVPVTMEPVPMVELDASLPLPVVQALAASWLLMQQPQLVERTREAADKAARRNAARAGLPDPEVTVIDLRRQYAPQDRDPDDGQVAGRRYRHRWVVSGHWRQQPYGPGREQRRQQWIPAYVKGPDGAPLLQTERVNVWRR